MNFLCTNYKQRLNCALLFLYVGIDFICYIMYNKYQ